MKTVIIEDNVDVRELLRSMLLKLYPDAEITGTASSVSTGLELIRNTRPALLLLDIQLRDGTVFSMLDQLEPDIISESALIFVTAFGTYEYIYRALRHAAIDYLMKPIDEDQFKQAVFEAQERLAHRQLPQQLAFLRDFLEHKKQPRELPKVPIHLPKGVIEFVNKEDILYLHGEENITRVHLRDSRKLSAMRNLGCYEDTLCDGASFFRISKQDIINLQYLERFDATEQEVFLISGISLYTSRRQGRALREFLK